MSHQRAQPRRATITSNRNMPSPPSSPLSTADRTSLASIDDTLEGSFLIINGDEDDAISTIGSSTVGSIHESVIGEIFSDSSGEEHTGRELWDESTDEGSYDGNDRDGDDFSHVNHSDGVLLPSPSMPSGEWTDAEATISDLSESRPTIFRRRSHSRSRSPSSSQVQLIMPDPASSFFSSSDGTTPSGSLIGLVHVPQPNEKDRPRDERRYVDKSWLEASSKLWNIAPEVQSMISEDGLGFGRVEEIAGPYALLESNDNLNTTQKNGTLQEKVNNNIDSEKPVTKLIVDRQQLRTALASANMAGLKGTAKKWSVRMSVLALASVLSLALYQSFGPNTSPISPANKVAQEGIDSSNMPILTNGRTHSIWNRLSSAPLEASTTDKVAVATQRVPDFDIIKHALSTLSTTPVKGTIAEPSTTEGTPKKGVSAEVDDDSSTWRKRKAKASSSSYAGSCCAVSVRNIDALSVPPVALPIPVVNKTWSKVIRESIRRSAVNVTDPSAANETGLAEPCSCSMTHHFRLEMMSSINRTFSLVPQYAASAAGVIVSIYRPAIEELRKEYDELIELAKAIAESTATLSQLVIRRAARGVSVARNSLEMATQSLRNYVPPLQPGPVVDHQAIARAKAQIDHLSEYVEDQAAILADYVEEQSSVMHDKGMETLRQAKRGLIKLITEARKVVDGEEHAPKRDRPMPFAQMDGWRLRPARERLDKNHGRTSRRMRRRTAARLIVSHPPAQEPSRGRKLLNMVHHGAMALVL